MLFCGVPCGVNLQSEQKDGKTIITTIVLFTSSQDKVTFETLKNSISKRFGKPDIEEYEGGIEEIDGRCYGKCRWDNGGVLLRNVHGDEGGLLIFISSAVNNGHLSEKGMTAKADSSIKSIFTWKDSKGDTFPIYMSSKGSSFIIRTSKSGEKYRAYLGEEVSEIVNRQLKSKRESK